MGLFRKKQDFVYSTPPTRKSKRVIIIITIIALGFIAVFLGLMSQKQSSYKTTSAKFLSYVQKGDAVSSYNLFDSNAKTSTTQKDWAVRVSKLQSVFKGQKPKFTEETSIKSADKGVPSAYLDIYKITGSDGIYTIEILVTDNASPKVLNFSSKRTSLK